MIVGPFPPWSTLVLVAIIRVTVVFVLFYGIAPYLMFPRHRGAERSTIMHRAIWMVFVTVAAVHFLTLAHLYSIFSLLAAYIAIALWTLYRQYDAGARSSVWYGALAFVGETADGRLRLWPLFLGWLGTVARRLGDALREVNWKWLSAALVLIALAIATYIRFVPVFHSAALPYSDSPIELAWAKYLGLENLYNNAIYPRGLYAFMSSTSVLAGVNPILILRLVYPALSLWVVACATYLAYRATQSLTASAVTAVLLGVSQFLPYVSRGLFQGNSSQQFGTGFALLFVAFAISYLAKGKRHDLTTSVIAGGMTAFIHPVAALITVLSLVALYPFALLTGGKSVWRRLLELTGGTALAAAVAVLPVTIALLTGQSWHSQSLTFLGASSGSVSNTAPASDLITVGVALTVVAVLSVSAVWIARWRGGESRYAPHVMLAGVSGVMILPFLIPHLGLSSLVLSTRSVQSLVIGAALAAGLVWSLLEAVFGSRIYLTVPVTVAALSVLLWYKPPVIDAGRNIYPYYTDQMVYQTLRAQASFLPQSWTLVTGSSGYALALGYNYHQYPQSFIHEVRELPQSPADWVRAADKLGTAVSKHYVLMAEKAVPDAQALPASQVSQRLADGRHLIAWVQQNAARLHIHKVMDNSQLEVWYFSIPVPQQ